MVVLVRWFGVLEPAAELVRKEWPFRPGETGRHRFEHALVGRPSAAPRPSLDEHPPPSGLPAEVGDHAAGPEGRPPPGRPGGPVPAGRPRRAGTRRGWG